MMSAERRSSISTIVTVAATFMTRLRQRPWKACLTEKRRKRISPSPQYSRW